jgi:KaiC/GvpD/RAD55 family RecA-like ATPase
LEDTDDEPLRSPTAVPDNNPSTSAAELAIWNTLFDPADIELHDLTKVIVAEVERVKQKRAVFDSMSELRLLSQNVLRYRRQILGIKQFLARISASRWH